MEFKDYYKILGVSRTATADELKRAYRKLARKYHPDVSKLANAEDRFKEAKEAYEVLKDPEKRKAYDQLGANWKAGQDFRPPPNWTRGQRETQSHTRHGHPGDFSEFFETLFGGGFRGGYRQSYQGRGYDARAQIEIPIQTAYAGATQPLAFQVTELDEQGVPKTYEKRLNVRIPKGVSAGQHIRLAGQGGEGLGGGPRGDLYLEVQFVPHRIYRTEGKDVYLDLPIAPWEAALGATVQAPTPAGTVDLKIPPNSHGGQKLRLKGRGIPSRIPGDLYIILQIALPPADTERSKEFYRSMAKELAFNPRENLEG